MNRKGSLSTSLRRGQSQHTLLLRLGDPRIAAPRELDLQRFVLVREALQHLQSLDVLPPQLLPGLHLSTSEATRVGIFLLADTGTICPAERTPCCSSNCDSSTPYRGLRKYFALTTQIFRPYHPIFRPSHPGNVL